MAYLIHSGAGAVDLGVTGTKRDDISDYLGACLLIAPNTAGMTRVGPEFADSIVQWDEDRLNNDFVTDLTGGGQSAVSTTLNVSPADAAVLDIGADLMDTAASVGGLQSGEVINVSAIGTGNPTPVTIARGQKGSTATTHAQNAIWSIISIPTIENSNLGRDKSRARLRKFNYLHRQEINVNLSSEVIMRSRKGYTPGIQDELEYQFFNRTSEIVRLWNKALIYSKPFAGTNGTAGASGGDYSTMAGYHAWLDGTQNATSTTINFATQGFAAGAIDQAINLANITAYRAGVTLDWALAGPNIITDIGKLYNDRIRIQQDDNTRGFAAMYFRSLLGNEFRALLDGYVYDTSPVADLFCLDSGRWRIRPLTEQFYYVITAETLQDGDAVRALSKLSLEGRNTGTDVGQASYLVTNITP